MMKKKVVYAEPSNYFPLEIRKRYKLGEFAEKQEDAIKTKAEEEVESTPATSHDQ